MEHDCVMKADVKEMTDGVKSLTIDVAVMKADVVDLKAATVMMSGCVKTLTESLLIAQQNNITREKFYEALTKQEAAIVSKLDSISIRLSSHETTITKYPSPDEVAEADRMLRLHQTYFRIIWAVFGFAYILLFFIMDKLWVK